MHKKFVDSPAGHFLCYPFRTNRPKLMNSEGKSDGNKRESREYGEQKITRGQGETEGEKREVKN